MVTSLKNAVIVFSRVERLVELKKKRKSKRKNAYGMTRDLLEVTPNLVVGVGVAGMIPKLVP